MTVLVALKAANAMRWAEVRIVRNFHDVAVRLVAPNAKARYQSVAARTNVPWPFIAVTHEREASQRWNAQLGQGDPLDHVSVHVPRGRGPFRSWEDGAYDALVHCAPFAASNSDWSIGGLLTMLEQYNGLGYATRGKPSPYIWSGTDQYVSGKYVRDGVFDPSVVDQQLGCAGLLLTMMSLDSSISFDVPAPPQDFRPILRKGSDGEYVKLLQSKLGFTGKDIDGDFGDNTDRMLRLAQAAHNLRVDGICGPATWQALG